MCFEMISQTCQISTAALSSCVHSVPASYRESTWNGCFWAQHLFEIASLLFLFCFSRSTVQVSPSRDDSENLVASDTQRFVFAVRENLANWFASLSGTRSWFTSSLVCCLTDQKFINIFFLASSSGLTGRILQKSQERCLCGDTENLLVSINFLVNRPWPDHRL